MFLRDTVACIPAVTTTHTCFPPDRVRRAVPRAILIQLRTRYSTFALAPSANVRAVLWHHLSALYYGTITL